MGHYLSNKVTIGCNHISIEDIARLSSQEAICELSSQQDFVDRIRLGPATVEKLVKEGHVIYGVTTGLGESCTVTISPELIAELPSHVIQFHGCGSGAYFDAEQTRAILAARLISLAKGYSGVRLELLEQIAGLLKNDVLPRIPQEGSVGASGDLTPLSYIGAVLCGYRDVLYQGEVIPAKVALAKVGMTPLTLIPKEALALINGTSAMTGVACLAYQRALQISHLATRLTSLTILALKGNLFHYDETLFSVKPHPGQQRVAARIRQDLLISTAPQNYSKVHRIQDRYSTRCAPHIIGVLEDLLPFCKGLIEGELNSANDNPIIDVADGGRVFHGAMFYGGHIAAAMDTLKVQVANMADLMDRQMASLVDPNYSNGLPSNLSGCVGERAAINHGLKGLQISVSAWTAEALKGTMPASVFSRSTECHNQDKVSMGTIAARDCVRVLELTEQVVAGLMIAVRQAVTIREEREGLKLQMSGESRQFFNEIKEMAEFVEEDRFLDPIVRKLVAKIRDEPRKLY
ncbi:histidine ammonia-lyase [Folsomia candida]|uniref:Histidine ammonia-lyase n=1 Tax=Folsomia candida TaxID=158441 RepID=A0A226DTX6_FOLCA|nr:histidine ammonia-lyase [Folsomia candida]OXA48659.1 Histidine ammonia-lyase [Folsomia candida]